MEVIGMSFIGRWNGIETRENTVTDFDQTQEGNSDLEFLSKSKDGVILLSDILLKALVVINPFVTFCDELSVST